MSLTTQPAWERSRKNIRKRRVRDHLLRARDILGGNYTRRVAEERTAVISSQGATHLHVRVHILQDMNTKTVPPPLTVKEQLINWGFGHTAAGQGHDRGVVGLPQAKVRSINLNTACSFCGSK